jgi:hypothetical protein
MCMILHQFQLDFMFFQSLKPCNTLHDCIFLKCSGCCVINQRMRNINNAEKLYDVSHD